MRHVLVNRSCISLAVSLKRSDTSAKPASELDQLHIGSFFSKYSLLRKCSSEPNDKAVIYEKKITLEMQTPSWKLARSHKLSCSSKRVLINFILLAFDDFVHVGVSSCILLLTLIFFRTDTDLRRLAQRVEFPRQKDRLVVFLTIVEGLPLSSRSCSDSSSQISMWSFARAYN